MTQPARFAPYIAAQTRLPEFTLRAVLLGAVLGVIFGASSLYLVLKVGLTVSASIPVAVISLTLFRLVSRMGARDASILENNIAQTAGSAGESIAFGIGVTMPAILILGFDLELMRVLMVAATGALLGILMMIPLRRTLIVREHGKLKYPEGTACAEVLKAGASEESRAAASAEAKAEEARGLLQGLSANTIFTGFGIGLVYKTLMAAFKLWKDVPEKVFGAPFKSGSVSCEASPELLGVGYIIGPRIAGVMCAGGVLSYLVLIPMIKLLGESIPGAVAPGTVPIAQMSANEIRSAYVLYIGAGAVAAAGLISLVRSLPLIIGSLRRGLASGIAANDGNLAGAVPRTEQDIPLNYVLIGALALTVWIVAAPSLNMNLFGAVLLLVFGFLFVTVSSRLTGEIGSTSNPISGMTIATLLLTCLIFLALGWTGPEYYVAALSVGGVVCVAASNGGTTSQDLKTGFLVGSTPRLQQYAIIIGSLLSVLILGPILLKLNDTATVYVPVAQVAPQGLQVSIPTGAKRESLQGPQASGDQASYYVWHKTDDRGAPAGKYLLNDQGQAVWLVDPGINGRYDTRPDGTPVRKFDAPKATLMSYIIKGVLGSELPWGWMLLGVMLAIAVEMCGINSLNFAVGVYLPLATTVPMLLGGVLRWWNDRGRQAAAEKRGEDEATIAANADRSAGVLMASGYIAGGAIAGIIIALMAGVFESTDAKLAAWAQTSNPFYSGPWADALALIPFAVLTVILLWVGRDRTAKD
ncbi:MAG: oligopeptide transporter, OPT family [Steroidobacteraceae bacterium]